MPFFETSDGCELFYEIRAAGADRPFVVFLNGFTQTTVYWYGRVPVFKNHFSLLLYDARGQGRSGIGNQQLSLDRHVDDLAKLLAHLRIDRAHLVGLSHGARVALAYAAENPGNVGRLVLCGLGAGDSRQNRRVVSSWKSILASGRPERMAETIFPAIFGKVFFEHHRGIMTDLARGGGTQPKKCPAGPVERPARLSFPGKRPDPGSHRLSGVERRGRHTRHAQLGSGVGRSSQRAARSDRGCRPQPAGRGSRSFRPAGAGISPLHGHSPPNVK